MLPAVDWSIRLDVSHYVLNTVLLIRGWDLPPDVRIKKAAGRSGALPAAWCNPATVWLGEHRAPDAVMPGPSGSMLCDDGAAVRIRARAVYVCRCERRVGCGSGGASGGGRSPGPATAVSAR